MAKLLASVPLSAKYLRDERWDILGRLVERLLTEAKIPKGKEDSVTNAFAAAIIKAGAIEIPREERVSRGRFTPPARLRPMATDCKMIYVEYYDDGTLNIRKSNQYAQDEV